MIKRTKPVYALLLVIWAVIVVWQVAEHDRVTAAARETLINRSRDITTTLGLVIRSQRRFGGVVSQERLESALKELVSQGELRSVALFNSSGQTVASSGPASELDTIGAMRTGVRWDTDHVTVINLVDLGMSETDEDNNERPTIVLPKRDENAPPELKGLPPPEPRNERARPDDAPDKGRSRRGESNSDRDRNNDRDRSRRHWGRPNWMDETEYKAVLEKRGLHGLMIAMSTSSYRRTTVQDMWLRWIISGLTSIAVLGLGMAWRNQARSSELQLRLLRASEQNSYLKEMNLAAAGLAHETRNPLNIIRGLAQMISKQEEASSEVRTRSRDIVNETDRVTAQLNQFINYSRPRDLRRTNVILSVLIHDVVRALTYDIEEKSITLTVEAGAYPVSADEEMLRQALFNLLLNAVQAVDPEGQIHVVVANNSADGATLEVRDDGPGVPLDRREEIFKPYFTTHHKGTGLGLAVVQQIVQAHRWEIACLSNQPRGAVFRITQMKQSLPLENS